MSRFANGYSKAEVVRRETRGIQIDRSIRSAKDTAPSAPRIDPNVLADPSDNTLKASILKDPVETLEIMIDVWDLAPPPGEFDSLFVYHQVGNTGLKEQVFAERYAAGDAATKFPVSVELMKHEQGYLADGDHVFFYEVQLYNGDPLEPSAPLRLRFDRIGPNQGEPPTAVPVIPVINDGNIGTIAPMLPTYGDWAEGDWVYWWVGKDIPEGEPTIPPAGSDKVAEKDQLLSLPRQIIEALGDGEAYVCYVLVDKAGNKGAVSELRKVSIALGAAPADLQNPEVPLAKDGLVDREDAMLGIVVEIPAFKNFKPTDEVNARWGTKDLGWRAIGSEAFPLKFTVDLGVLRAQYGTPEVGTKPTNVSYQVRRGVEDMGIRAISVDVNFERIGPVDPGPDPDPEWPDPVNAHLPLAHVYGDGSNTPDVLGPEHDGKPAELHFEIPEGLEEDDLMQFFWELEHVVEADYIIKASDNAGDKKTAPLGWPYIQKTGNVTVKVHYQISRASVPNKAYSKDQEVVVNAVVLHPDAPQFKGVNGSGWLTCTALDIPGDPSIPPAIILTVDDLSQYGLKAGSKVHLYWWALHSTSGDELVIDWDEEITLGTDYPVAGFDWRIPYEDYVLPIYEFDASDHSGRGHVRYEFESVVAGAGTLVTVVSDVGVAKVAMHTTGGPCALP